MEDDKAHILLKCDELTHKKYLNNEVVISFYHRTLFLVFKSLAYKPTAAKPVSAAAYISSLQQYNSYALLPRGV